MRKPASAKDRIVSTRPADRVVTDPAKQPAMKSYRSLSVIAAVITFAPVHAKTSVLPARAICGKPLERAAPVAETVIAASNLPSGLMRRMRTSPPVGSFSNQHTNALPSASMSASTRPAGLPSSTVIGSPKLAPASLEKASFTRGLSLTPVNQATATRRPEAAIEGPFTGQPLICQPSLKTETGWLHLPSRGSPASTTSRA